MQNTTGRPNRIPIARWASTKCGSSSWTGKKSRSVASKRARPPSTNSATSCAPKFFPKSRFRSPLFFPDLHQRSRLAPSLLASVTLWILRGCLLFADQMRIILFVFAERFNQLLVRKKIQACELDGPWPAICLWVLDGEFQIDVPEVAATVAFGDVRRFGLRVAVHVQPPYIVKGIGLDDQRVAIPLADGVTVVGRLGGLGQRTSIHKDLAVLIIGLEKNRNDLRSLDNLARRRYRIEIRHAVAEAALGRMAFLQVRFALLVERFCRRQHGNLNSIGAQVLKIFVAVPDCPDARQVRLAIRSLGRRSREVRFSIRRPRNPGCGVVLPLCREWNGRPQKNDESQNRSRNCHISLPLDTSECCVS